MSIATQQVLNDYARALDSIEKMEAGIRKSIEDLKKLKNGEYTLEQLIVTDTGYEFMPAMPAPEVPPAPEGGADDNEN